MAYPATSRLPWAMLPAIACLLAAPAAAETGSLGNKLGIPFTYQTGIPDAQGNVAWESHTLAPCETHEWSWNAAGQPNVHFLYPFWRDQRKDESGNVISQRSVVPMTDRGALTVFWFYGDQVWLDSSGAATMADCVAPQPAAAAPAPAADDIPAVDVGTPEFRAKMQQKVEELVALADGLATELRQQSRQRLEALIARAEAGEIILVNGPMVQGAVSVDDLVSTLVLEVMEGRTTRKQATLTFILLLSGSHRLLEQLREDVAQLR